MVVVTNRMKVRKGMGAKMAPRFTAPGPLDSFKGIVKVEVLLSETFEEYDELNVNMYWESLDDFSAWKNSDAFHAAHKRPEAGTEAPKESPLLGSEIITFQVAALKELAQ